mmetsp:Transcript_60670/g.135456  ORF Transcript_60670/g.135456 Transcript_60670/m.135456 type:complete len:266 (-) Transcript_60670:40-837(-)
MWRCVLLTCAGLASAAALNCTECWQSGFATDDACCKACPSQCHSGTCAMMHSQGYKCYDPHKEIVCDLGTGNLICEKAQVCPSAGPSCSGRNLTDWACHTCPPGQRPDESHCRCLPDLKAEKIIDVGNRACPEGTSILNASKVQCADAAEVVWPGSGCYGRGWKAIVKSVPDGRVYPAGCVYEEAAGGGCALLYNPDGQATKCPENSLCHVLCDSSASCLASGMPCNPKKNTCCKDPTGTPMQCVSMGSGPVCISGAGSEASVVV